MMATTEAEGRALARHEEQDMSDHVRGLKEQLRLLDLAGLARSARAEMLRSEVDGFHAALQRSREARQAEEAARRRQEADWKMEQARREREQANAVAAAVEWLEPVLRSRPVLKADVIARAEEAGHDRAALGAALSELDAHDLAAYGERGRLGPPTHWTSGRWVGAGFQDVGPATV
jgi:DNA repair exonuclease SbcCD ATPase subunit